MNLAIHHAHGWAVTPAAAVTRQRQLAPLVREEPLFAPPQSIAGVDMSVRGDQVQAAVVLLSYPALTVLEQAIWQGQVEFPYVSVGHRITLPEAIEFTLACTTRYRLPEPTRQAHLLSKKQ